MQKISNPVEFKKIREFGEIINDTFLFVKQNFKPLFKVFIYLCGFFLLATMGSSIMQQLSMNKIINNPGGYSAPYILKNLFTFQYLLVIVFGFLNYTAVNVTVLCFINLYVEKGNLAPTIEEVWAYFKYYFLRMLGSSFVTGLFLMTCFACCIIPGIYVFPAMSLFFPVMIMENGSLSYSFSRAFRLLKDEWWATSGTLFIIWIITYATTSLASLPGVFLTLFSVFTSSTKTPGTASIIFSTVIQNLCQVFLILPIICISMCYFNLLERKDNTGLIDRLGRLGEKKDPFGHSEEY